MKPQGGVIIYNAFTIVVLSLALVSCSGLEVNDKPMKEAEKVADKPVVSEKNKEVVAYTNQPRPLINNLIDNGDELRVMLLIGAEDHDEVYTSEYLDTIYFICERQKN